MWKPGAILPTREFETSKSLRTFGIYIKEADYKCPSFFYTITVYSESLSAASNIYRVSCDHRSEPWRQFCHPQHTRS
jgi:hypothetical protein